MKESIMPHCPTLSRIRQPRLDAVRLNCHGSSRFFVTDAPGGNGCVNSLAEEIGGFLREHGAHVAAMDLFGPTSMEAETRAALERTCGPVRWPVTWIDGSACTGKAPIAAQFYAISGTSKPVMLDGRIVGTMVEDNDARYVLFGGLRPVDPKASRTDQTLSLIDQLERALAAAGMDFHNVVRTWLYCNRILEWYDELNRVRNEFFTKRGVYDRLVPASTGVGTGNPFDAALVADALAVVPLHAGVVIRAMPSPLQCPAPAYGSAFSRAVEVQVPGCRRLYISGTASIHPGGETAHVGDVDAQVDLSMRVVKAILDSGGYGWKDINRAVAYFKRPADAVAWNRWVETNKIPAMPAVVVKADICRDDLLFEVEADALRVV
ncbi:MAG: endoribonuclease L-PSP [Verrucomicrobia bacterium]|nr:endoribonuclease L-PSP [Verrucomicrobiota bacterium]